MEYRILGNTRLSVSVIALGCEGFVGKTEEQVHSEMDFAISKGINFIDMYASNPDLRSNIGKALAGAGSSLLSRDIYVLPGKTISICVPVM